MRMRTVRWALVGTAVLVVAAATLQLVGMIPKLDPFGVSEIDRSQPALLTSVRKLSQYHAAAGRFQVVIDIEKDVKWMPAALAGERTLFVAAGSVNAYVDFSQIASGSLVVSPDNRSVHLTLPKAVLNKPNLDNELSYVFSQSRGLINRLGAIVDVPNQQQFYVTAEQRIAKAAEEAGLTDQAEENTKVMLTGMVQALGFEITIVESA